MAKVLKITTEYKVCASDVPENWLISVIDLVEEINKNSSCAWTEILGEEVEAENPFQIEIEIEKYVVIRLTDRGDSTSEGVFEYSSLVFIPATITFYQNGEPHRSELDFSVHVMAHDGGYSESIDFGFGDIAQPYDAGVDGEFVAYMSVYDESQIYGWNPSEDRKVGWLEIVAQQTTHEHAYSIAECTKPL